MIHINEVIVVEGKYDKEQLKKITDAPIICTYGFQLYRSPKIINSLRTLSKKRGIIVLTDSDRAGFRIRNYIKQCLGEAANIKQAYIPAVKGKEKRKPQKSKEGLLGVEGVTDEVIIRAVKKSGATIIGEENTPEQQITKADLYMLGLTGTENSAKLRLALLKKLDMPSYLSTNAMLAALNCLYSLKELKDILNKLCS